MDAGNQYEAGGREQPVWQKVHGVWRPIYGGFAEHGVSVEWHDFQVAESLAWSESFHEESLEICLNYTGQAALHPKSGPSELGPGQVAVYASRDHLPRARRHPESLHRFLTVELSPAYLRAQFAATLDALLPEILRFLENPGRFEPWLRVEALSSTMLAARTQILEPPVNTAAFNLWYQGKVLEILAQTLFRPDRPAELFCHRHKRRNRERVERVKFLLERDLENPPSLEMLAAEVECSPFYLSRLFAGETGSSMPGYLRLKRVEKAAELMAGRGLNVTDAAMAVGYSSLSAFQKAFAERFGTTPGSYVGGRSPSRLSC